MKKISFYIASFLLLPLILLILVEVSLQSYISFKSYEDKKTHTIYLLGGSTSIGEPYQNKLNFTKLVVKRLKEIKSDMQYEIVTLAHYGQDAQFNQKKLKYQALKGMNKNSSFFIYMGINDNLVTTEANIHEKANLQLFSFFNKSIIGSLILDKIKIKTTYGIFGQRIEDIFYWASKFSKNIYVSDIMENLHDFPPYSRKETDYKYYKEIESCFLNITYAEQLACFEKIQNDGQWSSYDRYYKFVKAVSYKDENEDLYYKLNNELNLYTQDRRHIEVKNEIIKNISLKNKVNYLNHVDKIKNKHLGFNLYHDAHHPRLEVVILIANEFLKAFTKNQNDTVGTLEEISKYYGYDQNKNQIEIWEHDFRWHFYTAFVWATKDHPITLVYLHQLLDAKYLKLNSNMVACYKFFLSFNLSTEIEDNMISKIDLSDPELMNMLRRLNSAPEVVEFFNWRTRMVQNVKNKEALKEFLVKTFN